METAIILVDAVDAIQVGTELVSSYVDDSGLPRMFFVNGMDKENADFQKTLDAVKSAYGTSVAPLVIPISAGASFKGVVDLVAREAYEYTRDGNGIGNKIEIPADMKDIVDSLRQSLMESVAETDEDLMNKYFEAGELTDELRADWQRRCFGSVHPLRRKCSSEYRDRSTAYKNCKSMPLSRKPQRG